MHKYPKVNYIGNKEKICDWIVENMPIEKGIVLDLFSGGCSVSYALKNKGYIVHSNDVLYSNFVLAKAIIENNNITLDPSVFDMKISQEDIDYQYSKISFLIDNLYYDFEAKELAKLLAISNTLDDYQKYIFLALLRRAMIRKLPYSRMNVPWEQIKKLRDEDYSYQKYGRKRAYHNYSFEKHMKDNIDNFNRSIFDNNHNNKAFCLDVFDMLNEMDNVDIIYLDPPYPNTMNNYNAFYGSFDKMFFDNQKNYLDLTKKDTFVQNMQQILDIAKDKCNYIVFSINNKCLDLNNDILQLLNHYGTVKQIEKNHNYQVTNMENKNNNKEILYIVSINK